MGSVAIGGFAFLGVFLAVTAIGGHLAARPSRAQAASFITTIVKSSSGGRLPRKSSTAARTASGS